MFHQVNAPHEACGCKVSYRDFMVCLCYSSGVVWEMKPKNRWKPFSQKNINLLEKTYQSLLSGKMVGGWVKLETNLEVRGTPTDYRQA